MKDKTEKLAKECFRFLVSKKPKDFKKFVKSGECDELKVIMEEIIYSL